MTLKEKIEADIKSAMLSRDNLRRDVLRFIKSEVSREEAGLRVYGDADIIRVINKAIKNLETIGSDKSRMEIVLLNEYLPKQMTIDEIEVELKSIIDVGNFSGMKSMGIVMKEFTSKFGGTADGKVVSEIVKKLLV